MKEQTGGRSYFCIHAHNGLCVCADHFYGGYHKAAVCGYCTHDRLYVSGKSDCGADVCTDDGIRCAEEYQEIKHPWFDRILDGYEKVLRVALRFKPIVLICVVVFLVASVTLSVSKGFTFMDMNMETEQLTVTVSAKEDEKLTFEELTERADEVVDKISGISGVDSIGAMARRRWNHVDGRQYGQCDHVRAHR